MLYVFSQKRKKIQPTNQTFLLPLYRGRNFRLKCRTLWTEIRYSRTSMTPSYFTGTFRYGLKSTMPIILSPLYMLLFIYLYKFDALSHNHYIPKHDGYGAVEVSTNLSSYRNELCSYVFLQVVDSLLQCQVHNSINNIISLPALFAEVSSQHIDTPDPVQTPLSPIVKTSPKAFMQDLSLAEDKKRRS